MRICRITARYYRDITSRSGWQTFVLQLWEFCSDPQNLALSIGLVLFSWNSFLHMWNKINKLQRLIFWPFQKVPFVSTSIFLFVGSRYSLQLCIYNLQVETIEQWQCCYESILSMKDEADREFTKIHSQLAGNKNPSLLPSYPPMPATKSSQSEVQYLVFNIYI